jgi:hypothetical protein
LPIGWFGPIWLTKAKIRENRSCSHLRLRPNSLSMLRPHSHGFFFLRISLIWHLQYNHFVLETVCWLFDHHSQKLFSIVCLSNLGHVSIYSSPRTQQTCGLWSMTIRVHIHTVAVSKFTQSSKRMLHNRIVPF